MAGFGVKKTGNSKYYNVLKCADAHGRTTWQGRYNNTKWFDEEINAAKWVDMQLIADGKEPRNVLNKLI